MRRIARDRRAGGRVRGRDDVRRGSVAGNRTHRAPPASEDGRSPHHAGGRRHRRRRDRQGDRLHLGTKLDGKLQSLIRPGRAALGVLSRRWWRANRPRRRATADHAPRQEDPRGLRRPHRECVVRRHGYARLGRAEGGEKAGQQAETDGATPFIASATPRVRYPKYYVNGIVTIMLNIAPDGRVLDATPTQCTSPADPRRNSRARAGDEQSAANAIKQWRVAIDTHGKPLEDKPLSATLLLAYKMRAAPRRPWRNPANPASGAWNRARPTAPRVVARPPLRQRVAPPMPSAGSWCRPTRRRAAVARRPTGGCVVIRGRAAPIKTPRNAGRFLPAEAISASSRRRTRRWTSCSSFCRAGTPSRRSRPSGGGACAGSRSSAAGPAR